MQLVLDLPSAIKLSANVYVISREDGLPATFLACRGQGKAGIICGTSSM